MMDKFMEAAIAEAKQGLKTGGIPIGSVLVKKGQIIGRGHNKRVQEGDPITHAEIDCLRNAGRIGSYQNTILYPNVGQNTPSFYKVGMNDRPKYKASA